MIDVKEAAKSAVAYFADLFEGKSYRDLLLEEVDLDKDKNIWLITLGFTLYASITEPLEGLGGPSGYERKYKIFEVNAETGTVLSMKIRTVEHA